MVYQWGLMRYIKKENFNRHRNHPSWNLWIKWRFERFVFVAKCGSNLNLHLLALKCMVTELRKIILGVNGSKVLRLSTGFFCKIWIPGSTGNSGDLPRSSSLNLAKKARLIVGSTKLVYARDKKIRCLVTASRSRSGLTGFEKLDVGLVECGIIQEHLSSRRLVRVPRHLLLPRLGFELGSPRQERFYCDSCAFKFALKVI